VQIQAVWSGSAEKKVFKIQSGRMALLLKKKGKKD